jgi:hypothetical protein
MPDDIYDEEASQTEAGDESTGEETENEDSSEETALLPKSFFHGKALKPGNVCKIKVDEVYEDEVMVSYVRHDSDSEDSEDKPESMMKKRGMMDEAPDEMYA